MQFYFWLFTVFISTLSVVGSIVVGLLYNRGGTDSKNMFTWDSAGAQGAAGLVAQLLSIVLALFVGTVKAYTQTSEQKTMAWFFIGAHLCYHGSWILYCLLRWLYHTFPRTPVQRISIALAWAVPQLVALGVLSSAGSFYNIDSFGAVFVLQFFLASYAILPDGVGYIIDGTYI